MLEEKWKENFLFADDFKPPLVPSNTIPDPDDKKPAKWDDDASMDIEDEGVVKPKGWLDKEPVEVDEPENLRLG